MNIIILSGWRKSGKDTVADYLVKEYGYIKLALAKPLKELVAKDYNIPLYWLENPNYKEKCLKKYPIEYCNKFDNFILNYMKKEFFITKSGVEYWTPRALLILEGSVKRAVNSDYWTNKIVEEINNYDTIHKKFVISDIRFKNEIEILKKEFKNLKTVRVNRFDSVKPGALSERELDNYEFDYIIDNTDSLENLYKQVDNLIKKEV